MTSFCANGHEYHLYVYCDVKGVPDKVVLRDANEIIRQDDIFSYKKNGSYAAFANWFRMELLHEKGNYWVDTDIVCLRPFDFTDECIFGQQQPNTVNAAVLKFPKAHKITRFMADLCKAPNTVLPYDNRKTIIRKLIRKYLKGNRRGNIRWGETGPAGFSKALNYFGLFNNAKPTVFFYPVHYHQWRRTFDETSKDTIDSLDNSYSIHLWNEMMRRAPDFDKNAAFPPDSLIENLKRRYL